MNLNKETLKSFLKSKYLPFFVSFLLLCIFNYKIHNRHGDDLFFSQILSDYDFFPFLKERYYTWSSGIYIEAVLIIVVKYPFLFKVINITLILSGIICISKFPPNPSQKTNWFLCLLLIAFPFNYMSSAGWIATSVNYMWPLMLGIIALNPIRKIYYNKKIKIYEHLIYPLVLLFASNQEQMAAILLAFYTLFFIYFLIEHKKTYKFILLQLTLIILSFIFIITCPGNSLRNTSETATWFPKFADLSLYTKLSLGYTFTGYRYIFKSNTIFFIFSLLLFLTAINLKNIKKYYIYIARIPLFVYLSLGLKLLYFIPPVKALIKKSISLGENPNLLMPDTTIFAIIFTIVLLSVVITIHHVFSNKKKALFIIFIFLLGLSSRMIMSFSPTIFGSGTRTFTFMTFSIIICSFYLFMEFDKIGTSKMHTLCKLLLWTITIIFTCISYIETLSSSLLNM